MNRNSGRPLLKILVGILIAANLAAVWFVTRVSPNVLEGFGGGDSAGSGTGEAAAGGGAASIIVMIGVAVILGLLIGLFFWFRSGRERKMRYLVGTLAAILACLLLMLGSITVLRVTGTLRAITGSDTETAMVGVYVLDSSEAKELKDLDEGMFGIVQSQSRGITNDAIERINKELDTEIAYSEYRDSSALADALLDEKCDAMILNESLLEILYESEKYADLPDRIRMIAEYECQKTTKRPQAGKYGDTMLLFITGIDADGPVSTVRRSDVNILAVANLDSRQVLLLNTPRDYYVPLSISDGKKDKLTHAGLYGVDVSMDTMSMLYDQEIDQYVRVNFRGFRQIIDALGGVTVQSDEEFTADGHHFVVGENTLNGEEALAFARERHSFEDGDRQRGRNQMAVIQAVIEKLQTPAVLNNFDGLIRGLEGSFETNVPYSTLRSLVRQQLSAPSKLGAWKVSTYSVDGTGEMNTTYTFDQNLYVMVPDQSTVNEAKRRIARIEEGKALQ